MRRFLALLFALGLFVPLAACGGDDGDEDASGSASASASATEDETTTTTEDDDEGGTGEGANPDSEYCDTVQDVIDSGEAFGDDFDFQDEDALEFANDALEELRDTVDDDDIAEDYDTIIDGFGVLAAAFAQAGDDPEAQAEIFADPELTEAFEEFGAAGERIDTFTLEQCGVTLDGETETAESGSDSGIGDDGEDTSLEDFAEDVEGCEDGDMAVCDQLFRETPVGSEAEAVALECGGEDPGGEHRGDCEETFG